MNTAALSNPHGIKLQVTGMTCASCVMRVEKTLKAVPGVTRRQRQPRDRGGHGQWPTPSVTRRCPGGGGAQGRLRRRHRRD